MDEPSCRFCGQTLAALERMRGLRCDRLDCRRREADERLNAQRDVALARLRSEAAAQWPDVAVGSLATVWLRAHEVHMAPLTPAERQGHAAHLAGLVSGAVVQQADRAWRAEAPCVADPAEDAAAVVATAPPDAAAPGVATPPDAAAAAASALGLALCAACGGWCCRIGGEHHGFVGAAQLQRWRAAHPGCDADAAAAAYLAALPDSHVDGGCLYQGAQGCALPRAMRADVCNAYSCSALDATIAATATATATATASPSAVLAIRHHGVARRVSTLVLVSAEGNRALPEAPEGDSTGR